MCNTSTDINLMTLADIHDVLHNSDFPIQQVGMIG